MKEKLKKITEREIIFLVVGLLLGLLTMVIFYPERIAELKNKEQVAIKVGEENITADDIYTELKKHYSLKAVIELVDKTYLESIYELTDEDHESIKESVDSYINQYTEYYEITEEEFLLQNGFETREDFEKYFELDYMRNKFYNEYIRENIEDEEIEKYYNKNVFGTVTAEHILVQVTEDVTEQEAEKKAKEIIKKLKAGTTWEKVKEEYKSDIKVENLTVEFDTNYETTFMDGVKALKDGKYSTTPVETSYGYHVINRISSEEKKELKEVKSRIIEKIVEEKEANDANIYEKTMIKMREVAKMEIKDTELLKEYEEYTKEFE